MSPLDELTVVVVHYQTTELTGRCLRALVSDGVPPGRIVVVDNGSHGDGVWTRGEEFRDSRAIRLEENTGYARAANAGAAALPGRAYAVLNNDAFVHRRGSVERLLAALDDPAVGVVAPRLLNPDLSLQPTARPADRPLVALVRASGLSRLVPRALRPRLTTHWDHSSARSVELVDGPVLLVRGETWDELGGYNARIRMFAEDSDLCWRAAAAGWKVWFEPAAEFVHLGNASAQQTWSKPERGRIIGRSEALLLREQLRPVRARVAIGLIAAGLAVRWAAFAALGRRARAAYVRAQLGGYLSGLTGEREAAPEPAATRVE